MCFFFQIVFVENQLFKNKIWHKFGLLWYNVSSIKATVGKTSATFVQSYILSIVIAKSDN